MQTNTYNIMYNISKSPRHSNTDEGHAHHHPVQQGYQQCVEDPHALAVEVRMRRIVLTTRRAHIHLVSL